MQFYNQLCLSNDFKHIFPFRRLGTKSNRQVKCQGRSTAKSKLKRFACIAFTFHPPVGNFAGRGEMVI